MTSPTHQNPEESLASALVTPRRHSGEPVDTSANPTKGRYLMPVDTRVDDGMISDAQLLQDATSTANIRSCVDHPSTTSSLKAAEATPSNVVVLDSCYSTWVFDPRGMRFRRILKGIEFTHRVTTAWRPYWGLHLDPDDDGFTVYLNADRTRLIRSWRHTPGCAQCLDARRSSSDLTAGAHW